MKDYDVVGVGVSTIDMLQLVDHFPAQEEVQRAEAFAMDGGGPVATAIATVARLGGKAAIVDALGDDWRGKEIIEGFRREGVEVGHVKVRPGFNSSVASILVRKEDGARTIIYSPGSAPELTAAEISSCKDLIARSRFVHMNGRHLDACWEVCGLAKTSGTKISFDGGSHRYRDELRELANQAHICILSRNFAEACTKQTDNTAAARTLLAGNSELVVITDGIKGSWVFPRHGASFHQPAFILSNVVDTTGCGDGFHGAFLFGLCRGWDLEGTSVFASAVAALNTQELGGRRALPTFEKVEAFLSGQSISFRPGGNS